MRHRKMLLMLVADGPSKSVAFTRLKFLETKFMQHNLLNEVAELGETVGTRVYAASLGEPNTRGVTLQRTRN